MPRRKNFLEHISAEVSDRAGGVRSRGERRAERAPKPEEIEMTRYMMSVFGPAEYKEYGNYPSEEAMKEALADTGVFNQRLQDEGYWVFADGLAPATTATVVDGQGAEPVVTDGPYLESKEYLGGFWIIEVPDLDVALRLAAEGSKACRGTVEVRPFAGE
jgi:hypothetical protein